jgi:tyrosyl-tRNA synthetase
MTFHKSDFLHIVKERGFFHQCTDEQGLAAALCGETPVTAYIGFDCTAPSLHVGSLMQIMILRWLQKCGHRPIVLMGGGTTKIGDPSGKDEARKLLDDYGIAANMQGIKSVFRQFLKFDNEGGNALMVNNADWLDKLNYIEFLRDYGRYFSVNRMLSMDSVKLRLEREQNLSFLEFNYMILQAYDFVELTKHYNCSLQIGGSDQWGNIVNGVELWRRMHTIGTAQIGQAQIGAKDICGLTTPLITTASGGKMGKTADGAVWLNADMLSPFNYWQFWRNTEDADVGKFLRFFTELPIAEIEKLEKLQGVEINEAKKILANEATKLCHGPEAALAAAETARKTFEEGGVGEDLKTVFIEKSVLEAGITAVDLLHSVGLQESKGAARKLIEGGGARVNDEKITDPKTKVTSANLTPDGYIKLSAGKKQHLLVKIKD